jgi:REP element-mobilizing transposase RayT
MEIQTGMLFGMKTVLTAGHRALRKGRLSSGNACYLVTTTTWQRQSLFANYSLASTASACLTSRSIWGESRLLCWVLMPDHLHCLFHLGDGEQISSLVCRVKSASARRVNTFRGYGSPVWGRAYHDSRLNDECAVRDAARYIVANPLRAGLVESIGDYPFWDAIWL